MRERGNGRLDRQSRERGDVDGTRGFRPRGSDVAKYPVYSSEATAPSSKQ
jgi:hypothetical protein